MARTQQRAGEANVRANAQGEQRVNKEQSLEKVRDILVGSQLRDYEGRFTRLETTLTAAIQQVRDDVRQRMDTIEQSLLGEVREANQRIAQEQSKRHELLKELESDIRRDFTEADDKQKQQTEKLNQQLDKKLAQSKDSIAALEQRTLESQQAIRQQILERYKTVSDDIQHRVATLEAVVKQALAEQAHSKVDRNALSAMLMETALRLADDGAEIVTDDVEEARGVDGLESSNTEALTQVAS